MLASQLIVFDLLIDNVSSGSNSVFLHLFNTSFNINLIDFSLVFFKIFIAKKDSQRLCELIFFIVAFN